MQIYMKAKIVFIHGMSFNPKCWQHWIKYFEDEGYDCLAPPWPFHKGEPEELRAQIPLDLEFLRLEHLHAHYSALLRGELVPPILFGHSLGGLLVQKLIAEGLGRAGVCIAPVAPNHLLAMDGDFLRNSAAIINPLAGAEPFRMEYSYFKQHFANGINDEEALHLYETYMVHESRDVLRDVMGPHGAVDLDIPHAPLLFIAGSEDRLVPASLVETNAISHSDEHSTHHYKEFAGRSHVICLEDNWEEVAREVADWLKENVYLQPQSADNDEQPLIIDQVIPR